MDQSKEPKPGQGEGLESKDLPVEKVEQSKEGLDDDLPDADIDDSRAHEQHQDSADLNDSFGGRDDRRGNGLKAKPLFTINNSSIIQSQLRASVVSQHAYQSKQVVYQTSPVEEDIPNEELEEDIIDSQEDAEDDDERQQPVAQTEEDEVFQAEPPIESNRQLLDESPSIDQMMDNLSLTNSISKIGQRPYLDESGSKVLMLPDNSRYLGFNDKNVSPSKSKVRKHIRKSHKTRSSSVDLQKLKQEYLAYLKSQSSLSVAALQKHILANHPKQVDDKTFEYKNWSICETIGSLINCSCCIQRRIHKINRSLGLGPSLYLLSLKSYLMLFFIASILAIPSVIVLTSGDQVKVDGVNYASMFQLFSRATLGNIGYLGSTSCQFSNLAKNPKTIDLICPKGVFAKITAVGLTRDGGQDVCSEAEQQLTQVVTAEGNIVTAKTDQAQQVLEGKASVFKNYVDFEPQCSSFLSSEMKQSKFITNFVNQFDSKCRGRSQCSIADIKVQEFNSQCADVALSRAFSSEFSDLAMSFDPTSTSIGNFDVQAAIYQRDPATPEPLLYIVGWCSEDTFRINRTEFTLTTDQLALFLIVSDLVIIFAIILGFNMIYYMQKDYVRQFDAENIEARDFTLVIHQLPKQFHQFKDELSLRFAIWKLVQDKLHVCKEQGYCHADLDCSIVEINFGLAHIDYLDSQKKVRELIDQIERDHIVIGRGQKGPAFERAKHNANLKAQHLQNEIDAMKLSYPGRLGVKKEESAPEEAMAIDEARVRASATKFVKNVKQVYVTFKSMQAKNLAEKLFYQRNWQNIFRFTEHLKSNKKELKLGPNPKDLQVGDQWAYGPIFILENEDQIYFEEGSNCKLDTEFKFKQVSCEPDIINWHNFNQSCCQVFKRKLVTLLVIGIIFGLTILFLYLFQVGYLHTSIKDSPFMNEGYNCDAFQKISMHDAWMDYRKENAFKSQQLMTCFCRQQFVQDPIGFFKIDFEAYGKTQGTRNLQTKKYSGARPCQEWFDVQVYQITAAYIPALIVVAMNTVIALPLIYFAARFERHKSKDNESSIKHYLILMVWFLNTIFVLFFFGEDHMGRYDETWYTNISSTLAFVLVQLFVPYLAGGLCYYLFKMLQRCLDRGLQLSLHLVTNPILVTQENSDLVSSKQLTQKQLQALYTGPQFDASMVQSQLMTSIFVTLFFSGTMPLLYPLCLAFLVAIYWYSKFMLLKFCQRSNIFNEQLILHSYKTMKYAVIMHLLMSMAMFMNSKMLYNRDSVDRNFDNQVTLDQSFNPFEDLKRGSSTYNRVHVWFIVALVILYVFNLLFVNPVSVFCQVGTCIKQTTDSRKKSKEVKNERIKKYIESSEKVPDIEEGDEDLHSLPQNQSIKMGSPSRQAVIQFTSAAKGSVEEYLSLKGTKMASLNYFSEITFDSLRFHYSNVIEAIIASNKRLNLYMRISNVNKEAKMCEVFARKYADFERYHNMLLQNKLDIEKQIYYYWNYIRENVDVEMPQTDNRSSNVRGSSLYQKKGGPQVDIEDMDHSGYFSNTDKHFQIRVNKIAGINSEAIDQNRENLIDYQEIMKALNEFQRVNCKQIQRQQDSEELELRQSCIMFFRLLDYLDMNFDEEWLRVNYLPGYLRCVSTVQSYNIFDSRDYFETYANNCLYKAEMILKNPLMFEEGQQVGDTVEMTKVEGVEVSAFDEHAEDVKDDKKSVKIDEHRIIMGETGSVEEYHNDDDSMKAIQEEEGDKVVFGAAQVPMAASSYISGNFGTRKSVKSKDQSQVDEEQKSKDHEMQPVIELPTAEAQITENVINSNHQLKDSAQDLERGDAPLKPTQDDNLDSIEEK